MAAPYATSRLAMDGARVIKVERPGGDFARGYDRAAAGQSSYFVWLNAGKESLTLDLRDGEDLALARRIAARADVVIENLAPGALPRLGLDLSDLRAQHPALITCSISGYGTGHAYETAKAYDLLVQAESGLCHVTGTPDGPGRVGFSVADIACGMQAYAAILKALIARGRDGAGQHVELSLFSTLAEWMAVPYLQARAGTPPARVGVAHPSIAPYGVYITRDGMRIVLSVQSELEWQRLEPRLLGVTDPRFASNVERVAHRAALDAAVSEALAALSVEEAEALLDECGIAHARLRDLEQAMAHPALRWHEVATPGGPVALPLPATGLPDRTGPVPAAGADSARLRREFAP